jgi:YVTN family beta-propeller protein
MAQRNAGKRRDRMVRSLLLFNVVLYTCPRLAMGQSCAYVANLMSDTVSVIDTVTNVVTATIPVGHNPNDIVTNAYGGLVCVTNYLSNDVSLIDPATNTVVATVAVGAGPVGVARLPGTDLPILDLPESFAYVANRNAHTVSVVEVGTAQVIATIGVDPSPDGIAVGYSSHGPTAYVTHSVSAGSVSVIDMATNTVTAKIAVGSRPGRVVFGPGGVYVTNFGSFNISVIDPSTNAVTATIGLSLKPSDIALTPDSRSFYVTNVDAPIVSIIPSKTNTVVAAITVGAQPAAVVHTRNRGGHPAYTYVANSGSDTVSVINRAVKNHVVATIPVGRMPFALAVGDGNCGAVPIPTLTPLTTPSATSLPTATPTPGPCVGDCDDSGTVTVDELVKGVNIALGTATLDQCPAFDCNANQHVTVDCLVKAVNAALTGCPG